MADDDLLGDQPPDAEPSTTGPRRSTYTPPSASNPPDGTQTESPAGEADNWDDDALANALAADLSQISSSIPIISPGVEPVPAPVEPPPPGTAPPWANAPAPSPDLLVEPGSIGRPDRRLVPEDELRQESDSAAQKPSGTLNMIEHLEELVRQRQEEAREARERERSSPSQVPEPQVEAGDTSGPVDIEFSERSPAPGTPPPPNSGPIPVSPFLDREPTLLPVPDRRDDGPGDAYPAHDTTGDVFQVVDEAAPADLPAEFQPQSASASRLDSGFGFKDLVGEEPTEPPNTTPHPGTAPVFIEPVPVAGGQVPITTGSIPVITGSIPVVPSAYDVEVEDDVDETDRVVDGTISGPIFVDPAGQIPAQPALAPSGPIATARIPEDEVVLGDNMPRRLAVFSIEPAGLEPAPAEHRIGRASRLFWLWFAANSSVISIGIGAVVLSLGMSLRQSIVAVLAGIAISFLPLGLSTLAGKRSGQPTMVVSRASFGLLGNILPAALALTTRLFWGAVLLWLLATSTATILVGAELGQADNQVPLTLLTLALALVLAFAVAFAGYHLIARLQLILSILSGVLVIGFIALTAQYLDLADALTIPDGSWTLALTGAVLVFSFVGLVWANSGADLARYQRPSSSGAASMLWATFGTTVPAFVLITYGVLLAASNRGLASGLVSAPLDTLALILPRWYPIPLLAAVALSLLSGVIITMYSAGFALQAVGLRLRRQWSVTVVAVALLGITLVLVLVVSGGFETLVRDLATTIAVPTAAWAGIFAAELMIRNRRFETESLLSRGGVYPDVHWVNLIMLVVASGIGFGLTSATVGWLEWQGYLFAALGLPLSSDLAGSDVGVLVALLLGILTPIVAGIPAIRRQESTRV